MRLVARLKSLIRPAALDKKTIDSGWLSFCSVALLSISAPAFAFDSLDRCGPDSRGSLPDSPVAIQRVERTDDGVVRVSWSLRTSGLDSEELTAPGHLQTGAEFDVVRCLPPGRWVAVGRGEVASRNGSTVEGLLQRSAQSPDVGKGVSDELVSAGNLYPLPMAGDLVVTRHKEITQVKKISPRITIPAQRLFDAGTVNGLQLELTQTGRESLRQVIANQFADAHGRLLIEVHSQRPGSRQKLRQETLQRAESIERFLRYEFGIDKDQMLAVGHGSDGYVQGLLPVTSAQDFVVLRVLHSPSTAF